MGSVEPRTTAEGKRRFRAKVRLQGHHRSKTFATAKRAWSWIRKTEAQIEEGEVAGLGSVKTLAEAVAAYRESEGWCRLSGNDRYTRSTRLDWWVSWFGSKATLSEVTVGAVEDALADLKRGKATPSGRPLSSTTRLHYATALSCAMALAVRRGWIKQNPVRSIERPRPRRGRERYLRRSEDAPELGRDELVALLKAARESKARRLYPAIVLLLATGSRLGEFFIHRRGSHTEPARWEDVVLHVRGSDGEDHGSRIHIRETKNRKPKTLILLDEVAEVLREYARVRPIGATYLMESHRGTARFPRGAWNRARGRAGLLDVRPHDLRHSAASYLAMQGYTPLEIAALLGCTVENAARYSHLSPVATRKAAVGGHAALRGAFELIHGGG